MIATARIPPWLPPAVLACALGLLGAATPDLWADELATWGAVTAPRAGLRATLGEIDAVLAPYYLLLRGWAALAGTSDLALRLPSVLATAATAGLTAAVGARLAGPRTGLVAGVLFALLPATSRYAQEARPYALAACLAAAATLLLLRALDRPGAGRWAAYAGALALLGLLHAVALLLVAAHAPVAARRAPVAWPVSAAAGVAPAVPLLWLGVAQRGQIDWIPALGADRLTTTPSQLFGTTLLGGVVIGLALLAAGWRPPAAVPTLWALAPAAGLLLASTVLDLWLGRYLLFTVPAWTLLAALAVATAGRAAAVLGCAAVLALPAQLDLRAPDGHGQATQEAATVIATGYRPGDVVVHGTADRGEDRVGRDLVARYLPADRTPSDVLLTRPLRTDGFRATECTGCLGTPPRVWVLRSGERADPLGGLDQAKRDALRGYRVERVWHPTGLTLALLVPGRP